MESKSDKIKDFVGIAFLILIVLVITGCILLLSNRSKNPLPLQTEKPVLSGINPSP